LIVSIAAALALMDIPELDAEQVVRRSMKIAGDMCIYTNNNLTFFQIDAATTDESKTDNSKAPQPTDL
jgi:ATP-dependent HslUV protease subunit HslV